MHASRRLSRSHEAFGNGGVHVLPGAACSVFSVNGMVGHHEEVRRCTSQVRCDGWRTCRIAVSVTLRKCVERPVRVEDNHHGVARRQ